MKTTVPFLLLAIYVCASCSSDAGDSPEVSQVTSTAQAPAPVAAPPTTAPKEPPSTEAAKTPPAAAPSMEVEFYYVEMATTFGKVTIELDAKRAPITVENFLAYVDADFYDRTIFHRVMDGFMIQGGGFTPRMEKKETRDPIKNEWENGLKNERYAIAMARTHDPDSATAQFFINIKDNPNLDRPMSGGPGYAVFGKVVAGFDVIDEIRGVRTTTRAGHGNVPVSAVLITGMARLSTKAGYLRKRSEEALRSRSGS